MQAIIPEIVYAVWCIFWAYANHRAIDKANEHILHGINGLCHLCICCYFGIEIHFTVAVTMLLEGRLFFDGALNIFRMGWRNIGYVPRYPKSIVDKMEKAVFGSNGIVPKILYAVAFVVFLIVQSIIL